MSVNVVEGSTENHNPVTDRCDRCGAQGYVVAENISGTRLVFCNHHGVEYKDKLEAQGFVVNFHALS
jgi:hypothetical protein